MAGPSDGRFAASSSPSIRSQSAHIPPSGPAHGVGPLRIGAYHIPLSSEAIHSWSEISSTIRSGDLADLNRHEACESEYCLWRGPIKAHFGDLETYIRTVRLEWAPPTADEVAGRVPGMEHFQSSWEEDGHAKCIPNDWPYGVPAGCGHYVVWSKAPMLHEALFQSDDTPFALDEREAIYDAVVRDGVRGLTGVSQEDKQRDPVVGLNTVQLLKAKGEVHAVKQEEVLRTAQMAHDWAGRHVNEYVVRKWPESQWETVSGRGVLWRGEAWRVVERRNMSA